MEAFMDVTRQQLHANLSGVATNSNMVPKPAFRSCSRIFLLCMAVLLGAATQLHAQITATLSGTVQDATGAVVPGAQVALVNEATSDTRTVQTNGAGLYVFPALLPSSYTLKITAKGFNGRNLTGIVLHAGDQITAPVVSLAVEGAAQSVTVEAQTQIVPMSNGERSEVLDYKDIQNLALEGRDTSELLKVLPGATSVSPGLNNGAGFSGIDVSAAQSAVGSGINLNGVPNRGGTSLLSDGVNILDPGDSAGGLAIISPEMTQEVSVQTANFGADAPFGPVVVSSISKAGGESIHGEGYFDARNDALNANDWQSDNAGLPKGGAHYYYPGGNVGGPIPFTHKRLLGWFGYERFLQNQGNANKLTSFIPSPEMLAGDFTADNPDNVALCPNGFTSGAQGNWCNDLTGTTLPDGSTVTNGHIPSQFLDPGAKVLESIWPKANASPAATQSLCGGCNYYQPIINVNNGWVWRARMDYNLSEKDKFFVSYQQGFSGGLSEGNGAHIFWTPANAIPYPGGGLQAQIFTKSLAGHFVHIFNNTTTNEFIASWSFANLPQAPSSLSAVFRSTLGYPSNYGTVFNGGSKLIPSYSSPGGVNTFPDFSEPDIFEPNNVYLVRKEIPGFTDNFTKIWRSHTFKVGAFEQNVGNIQGNDGTNLNGSINSFSGQAKNAITGIQTGSPNNPVANLIMGNATSYSESNSAPVSDMAFQDLAFYFDDSWKVSNRLSLQLGARIEHMGHWYDRQGIGMAAFFPQRVESDYFAGKIDPGFYWHGIDPGVPLSGQPNRLAFVSPRFGMSYDVFGTGKTLVRGGWGAYRFQGQYNDYAAALTTSQAVVNYSLPGQSSILLSQIGQLKPPTCTVPPCGVTGTQTALDSSDYSVPVTYSYNMTIDQQLPWNTLLEVAYVGSSSSQILDNGETIEGSQFTAFADQNKTPVGAFFKPDPVTGLTATNPENVATTKSGAIANQVADYRPFGLEYGTNSIFFSQGLSYTNYNGLQVSWLKRAGRLNFNINGTWSKTLGTGLQANPFVLRANYGVEAIDRPFVFNSAYVYSAGRLFHGGNRILQGATNGWTISGISTWQAGGNLLAQLGNGVPNFGLSESYVNIPAAASAAGVTSGIGTATYFGTDAAIAIQPKLTCNPNSGLAHFQRVQLDCFAPPAIGTNGGQNYPYFSNASYFDNDLALYKTFKVKEAQNVQFRFSAFNWLNHPLPEFSSQNLITLRYLVDYQSKQITLNTGPGGTVPNFGFLDSKVGAPNQRILELSAKYNF